ncbi:hypothetical protein [Paenibacillus radicis (ex Gao et al. 2016)]|uniref:N-acetyltransferase domain-containing protein n=1 Tax=Paenibacillus radicis (ex Gao et al. 2016) TaxID=1737354 RepID=A0A917GWG6_9BACL|nr:hypothetical protein [Paenibacillus radicis (ex Gao et al. 2016)]GGG59346.1 hypothetical protein GCM10010918_10650 [Paenibacillus radicis (ex Gao et al. 2016)]
MVYMTISTSIIIGRKRGDIHFYSRRWKATGFALVRKLGVDRDNKSIYSIAEFFVMKKYRQLGAGQGAAYELFNRFSGVWKVAQIEENKPAQLFWRKIIGKYPNHSYQEVREADWDGPIQTFSTETIREDWL